MKPSITRRGHALGLLLWLVASAPLHAAELRLHALLDGASVVSATDSPGTGEARAVLQDDGKLRVTLLVGGLAANVTSVELHTGSGNDNGPQVASMDASPNTQGGWSVNTVLTLTPDVVASVRAGNAYLLVTTTDFPSGALRGQLLPQPVRLPAPRTP
jgi:hypothetical protein